MIQNATQARAICRLCGALLTDTSVPCWCWYCHKKLAAEDIIGGKPQRFKPPVVGTAASYSGNAGKDQQQPKTLLTRIVRAIDKWDGSDKPITRLTFRDKKYTYLMVFVLALVTSVCIAAAGALDGNLWTSIIGAWVTFATVLVFTFKWMQLKRIPIDPNVQPFPPKPKHTAWHTSGFDIGAVYMVGAYITGIITFFACWAYAIATYGLFLGLGLGWFPASVIAIIVGLLWPVIALGGAVLLAVISSH